MGARYRIVQYPRRDGSFLPLYEVEKHLWLWRWKYHGLFFELTQAEQFIQDRLKADAQKPIKRRVLGEYTLGNPPPGPPPLKLGKTPNPPPKEP
jgi:hypothetical protein